MKLRFAIIYLVVTSLFAGVSSVSAADAARDSMCDAQSKILSNSDFAYSSVPISILTGCRQSGTGEWFWPTWADDKRLPSPILTSAQFSATAKLSGQLGSQIASFFGILSSYPDQLNPASSARANHLISLNEYTSGGTSFGWGVAPEVNPGSPALKSIAESYAEMLVSFAANPDNSAFRNYVVWWSERRYTTMPAAVQNLNPMAKSAYIEAQGFARAPWPWELKLSVNIAEYRVWAIENGLVPSATTIATAKDNCTAIALWLDGTSSRSTQASQLAAGGQLPQSPIAGNPGVYAGYAAGLEALADAQQASNPPTEALAANALIISGWRLFADGYYGLETAGKSGSQTEWDNALTTIGRGFENVSAAWEAILELKEDCGLT